MFIGYTITDKLLCLEYRDKYEKEEESDLYIEVTKVNDTQELKVVVCVEKYSGERDNIYVGDYNLMEPNIRVLVENKLNNELAYRKFL